LPDLPKAFRIIGSLGIITTCIILRILNIVLSKVYLSVQLKLKASVHLISKTIFIKYTLKEILKFLKKNIDKSIGYIGYYVG
jgi:hypothetical protein